MHVGLCGGTQPLSRRDHARALSVPATRPPRARRRRHADQWSGTHSDPPVPGHARHCACRAVGDDGGAEQTWDTSTAGQDRLKRSISQRARDDLDSLDYPSQPSGERVDSSFYESQDVSYADTYADDYLMMQSIEGFESLDVGDYPSLDGNDYAAGPEISGSIDNLDYDASAPPLAQPRAVAGGSSRLQPFSAGPLSQPTTGAAIDSDYEAANPDETYDDVADISQGGATWGLPDAPCDDPADVPGALDDTMDADALDNATRAEAGGADAPAVSGMSDLPQLRRALASDAYADNASSCLHSMAKLAQQLPRAELPALQNDPLLQEVLTIMDTRMHQFTAYRLAMCLWSFGHLQLVPSRVLDKLLRAVEAQLDDFSSTGLVNVLWAFAKLGVHPGRVILQRLFERLATMLPDLLPQGLANVVWACAQLGMRPKTLLDAIAAEAASRIDGFDGHAVSNICWALAKLGHRPPAAFLDAADRFMQANFATFSSQGISLVLYGLAMQNRHSPVLLDFVSREIEACTLQFSPQDLVTVIVAFAMMRYERASTIAVVLQQVRTGLDAFEGQPALLCSILWAVARLKPSGGRVFGQHVMHVIIRQLNTLPPRALANLVYGISALQIAPSRVAADVLGLALASQMPFMNGKQLGNLSIGLPAVINMADRRREQVSAAARKQVALLAKGGSLTACDMLHHLSSLMRMEQRDIVHIYPCLGYLLKLMRARLCTALDIAHAAHVVGTWRGGPTRSNTKHPVIESVVLEIEKCAVELLQIGELTPRHLSTVLWMYGRLRKVPRQLRFSQLTAAMLVERISEFNQVDMANVMYAFVAMEAAPGLQALDAMANHVNADYASYGQAEMAQVLYGFARLAFHPGAVVGRVMVVYNRNPDLFTANAYRLLSYALPVLEGVDGSVGASRDGGDADSTVRRPAAAARRPAAAAADVVGEADQDSRFVWGDPSGLGLA